MHDYCCTCTLKNLKCIYGKGWGRAAAEKRTCHILFICIFTHAHIMHMHACTHTYAQYTCDTHTHTHTHTHTYTYAHICTCTCDTQTHAHAHKHTHKTSHHIQFLWSKKDIKLTEYVILLFKNRVRYQD